MARSNVLIFCAVAISAYLVHHLTTTRAPTSQQAVVLDAWHSTPLRSSIESESLLGYAASAAARSPILAPPPALDPVSRALEYCQVQTHFDTGAPAPGILLSVRFEGGQHSQESIALESGPNGETEVAVPEGCDRVHIEARSPTTKALLAAWWGEPKSQVRLSIPSTQFIYGRLIGEGIQRSNDGVAVSVSSARRRGGVGLFLGKSQLNPDGTFMVPISPRDYDTSVSIVCTGPLGQLARVEALLSECTAPPGVEIEGGFEYELEVTVVAEDGRPIRGARCAYVPGDRVDAKQFAVADEAGRVKLVLPAGAGQLCASAPGRDARVSDVALDGHSKLTITLPKIDANTLVRCRVVDSSDVAIANAVVTLRAGANDSLGDATATQRRTLLDGLAELPVVSSQRSLLSVYHDDFGFTSAVLEHPMRNGEVIIRMESIAGLEVDVIYPDGTDDYAGSRLEYCVIDAARQRSWTGAWNAPPFRVDYIPHGEYVVLVVDPATGLVGACTVDVRSAAEKVRIELTAGQSATGRFVGDLYRSSSSPILAVLDHPELPLDVDMAMFSTRLDATGSFSLRGMDGKPATVRIVSADGTELGASRADGTTVTVMQAAHWQPVEKDR